MLYGWLKWCCTSKKPQILYIDEVDYLGQKDFNSILAILLDKPDTELWVTSTPDGEKQLYRLSQDEHIKSFIFVICFTSL